MGRALGGLQSRALKEEGGDRSLRDARLLLVVDKAIDHLLARSFALAADGVLDEHCPQVRPREGAELL